MNSELTIDFKNSYTSLPEEFYVKMRPEIMPDLKLIKLNEPLSELLGLPSSQLKKPNGINFLGGKNILPNEDDEISDFVLKSFNSRGIQILTETELTKVENNKSIVCMVKNNIIVKIVDIYLKIILCIFLLKI